MSAPVLSSTLTEVANRERIELEAERARLLLELRLLRRGQRSNRERPLPNDAARAVIQGVHEYLTALDREHSRAVAALRADAERESHAVLAAAHAEAESLRRAVSTMHGGTHRTEAAPDGW